MGSILSHANGKNGGGSKAGNSTNHTSKHSSTNSSLYLSTKVPHSTQAPSKHAFSSTTSPAHNNTLYNATSSALASSASSQEPTAHVSLTAANESSSSSFINATLAASSNVSDASKELLNSTALSSESVNISSSLPDSASTSVSSTIPTLTDAPTVTSSASASWNALSSSGSNTTFMEEVRNFFGGKGKDKDGEKDDNKKSGSGGKHGGKKQSLLSDSNHTSGNDGTGIDQAFEKAARMPLTHFILAFIVFILLTLLTVLLVNWIFKWFSRSRGKDEEYAYVGGSDGSELHNVEEGGSGVASSSSLARSDGNSSRQRFLESRRAAAQRNYGSTDPADAIA